MNSVETLYPGIIIISEGLFKCLEAVESRII